MIDPREVINQIRAHWGVGVSSKDKPLAQALEHMRRQVSNALELLSDQLYASGDHYLLELLQNADDNSYPSTVQPSVKISLGTGNVSLTNNEVGFGDNDVRALCGIGESTKKGKKALKIGEKGIGFKAVFKVCDQPEIHSGGYHFKFNRRGYDGLGMVVPEWIDSHQFGEDRTTIFMPLADGTASQTLPPFRPELLLFLRQIKLLICEDLVKGTSFKLRRFDEGVVIRVVQHQGAGHATEKKEHSFLVHRRTVLTSGLNEPLRPDIQSTDIVVALPIKPSGEIDGSSHREVFAFLPVEDSQFRFVAHADFVLSTSRESIQRDRAWNVTLRDEQGLALADAIMTFRKRTGVGQSVLRVITDPKSMTDTFLSNVLRIAIDALSDRECVLVGGGVWSKPNLVFIPSRFSEVVGEDRIRATHAKRLSVSVEGTEQALRLLGCITFGEKDLIDCIEDPTWLEKQPPEWFLTLYSFLGSQSLSQTALSRLQSAPIILLIGGKVVAPKTGTVFFGLSEKYEYGFEHELSLIHPHVDRSVRAASNASAKGFLEKMGVRSAEPVHIIDNHILPLHEADGWQALGNAALEGHARFIRDHFDRYMGAKRTQNSIISAKQVFKRLRIRTAEPGDSPIYWTAANLYVGEPYDTSSIVEALLRNRVPDRFISAVYAAGAREAGESGKWLQFFRAIGCSSLPRLSTSNQVPGHAPRWPSPTNVTDYVPSEELAALLKEADPVTLEKYFIAINKHWSELSHTTSGQLTSGGVRQVFDSSFLVALRNVTFPTPGGRVPLGKQYLDNESNRSVFGENIPYLKLPLRQEFVRALGIVEQPSVEQAILRLGKLSGTGQATFREAGRLYRFLEQRFEQNESQIRAAFRKTIILTGALDSPRWVSLDECCWSLPKELAGLAPVWPLAPVWSNLKAFFLDELRVKREIAADELVVALEGLAQDKLSPQGTREIAQRIYLLLGRRLASWQHGSGEPSWLGRLRSQPLLWTKGREWRLNDGDTFLADDPTIEQLFSDNPEIGFLDIDAERMTELGPLCKALQLQPISEAVTVTKAPSVRYDRNLDIETRLREKWPFMMRLLYREHSERFKDADSLAVLKDFRTVQVQQCEELRLVVGLLGRQTLHPFQARLIQDQSGPVIFVGNTTSLNDAISFELARYFSLEMSTGLAFSRILSAHGVSEADELLQKMHVAELPAEVSIDLGFVLPTHANEAESTFYENLQDSAFFEELGDFPVDHVPAPDGVFGSQTSPIFEVANTPADATQTASIAKQDGDGAGVAPPVIPDSPGRTNMGRKIPNTSFVSYVRLEAEDSNGQGNQTGSHGDKIDRAAVLAAVDYERRLGRQPEETPLIPGVDIKSFGPGGDLDRYIKVKGLPGDWDSCPVTLSKLEFEWASEPTKDATYWLYVVEYALDETKRSISPIADPWPLISRCSFDFGWRSRVESKSAVLPTEGSVWTLRDGRFGEVTGITSHGRFKRLHVTLADGSAVSEVWKPTESGST